MSFTYNNNNNDPIILTCDTPQVILLGSYLVSFTFTMRSLPVNYEDIQFTTLTIEVHRL